MAAIASASKAGIEGVELRAGNTRATAPLIAAALVGATLVLLPILYTVAEAVTVDFHDVAGLLFRPLVGGLLLNTISLTIASSLATAVIGTAAAWLIERTDIPGRNVWSVRIAAPLAIPPFITSYAWVSMSNALQDFAGALLVVTCAYYPLVYLPVAAALRGLDPALEETARSLGETAWGSFLRVVLPQLRPALLGGVLLVALDTLTEFGAFALLRFRTFTTELYAQDRTGLLGPEASVLALVLVALCLALLFAEFQVRGEQQRVALARALAPAPKLVLLDEPFSSLDAALRVETRQAVSAALLASGATTLLVTHDQSEALAMDLQVAVLRAGVIAQIATPEILYRQPVDAAMARFVGEAVILEGAVRGGVATCALGRLSIAHPGPDGLVDVMVRPEQIRFVARPNADMPRAKVLGVTFHGHDASVLLELEVRAQRVVSRVPDTARRAPERMCTSA